MDEPRCTRCRSSRVIADALMFDQGQGSDGRLQLGFFRKPDAAFFKGKIAHELRATICGDCGFVELFATDARALYADFAMARKPPAKPSPPVAPSASPEARPEAPPPAKAPPPAAAEPERAGGKSSVPSHCASCGAPMSGADWCSKCGWRYTGKGP